jgi:trimethylamine--corrinoid protein Co-methyltransferase
MRLLMARVQLLSEYYGCPAGVHGGKTDSCFLNEQAGSDKMASMLLPVLAGAVGIGTVGHVENAVTFSPVQIVLDDAMAGYVRHAIKPVEVNARTLAADVIDAVGPGGNFLGQDHTAENFRQELLLSPLFPSFPWEAAHAHPELHDSTRHATDLARQLWQEPTEPVLSDDQLKAIDALVTRYEQEN